MGILPATGTEIAMGKVYRAFGLSAGYPPAAGTGIGLNSTLGDNRKPPQASGTSAQQTAIPASTQTKLSEDFGGLTTAEDYPT
jgi:hypothetical protein